VQVIGVQVENERQGTFIVGALEDAIAAKRVELKDIAYVSREGDGKVKVHQTKFLAHFWDTGIKDKVMKSFAEDLPEGHGIVFALGDEHAIAAIADRVDQLTDGKSAPIRFDVDD
jgi:uncharacterized membrane protein